MQRHGRRTILILLALPLAILAACQGETRSGGLYTLKPDREIEAYVAGSVQTVHAAALRVVRDRMLYRVVKEASDAREGYIEARTAREEVVRVETFRDNDRVSRVQIYVGPLGDEPAMKAILDELRHSLTE